MKQIIYVGAYTTYPPANGERKEGLSVLEMDEKTGSLNCIQTLNAGENPSYITLSKDGLRLYAVNETRPGSVQVFSVDADSGKLQRLDGLAVDGDDPCHLHLTEDGRMLLAACYSSGSLAVLALDIDGKIKTFVQKIQHRGSGPNQKRQEKAHIHSTTSIPGSQMFLVADLGLDQVWGYEYEPEKGAFRNGAPVLRCAPGAGPRHMAFHPNLPIVYLTNELDSSVTACYWDRSTGTLEASQTLSTLPANFSEENTVADIHITPDGKWMYVSNRGHHSLAAFQIDPCRGDMRSVGFYPCGGKVPRNFAISPDGRFVLVANQFSENVVVFRIEGDGALVSTGNEVHIAAPVCVVFKP